jgi:hypothetical protein
MWFFADSMSPEDVYQSRRTIAGEDEDLGLPTDIGLRGPYFEPSASRNVTALVGKTAYLNCRVRNLGNKTVSHMSLLTYWFEMDVAPQFKKLFHVTVIFSDYDSFVVKVYESDQFYTL